MVFLYIIISLAAIIFALLFVKVVIVMDYQNQFTFDVKWLILKYRVYPVKEKTTKDSKPDEKKQKSKKPAKTEKPKSNIFSKFYQNQGFDGVVTLIQNTAASLNAVFKRALHAVTVKNLSINLQVAGEDSAQTAIRYGTICSLVFPAVGAIRAAIRVKEYHLNINPDFLGNENKASFHTVILVSPIKLIIAAIIFLFDFLIKVLFKLFLGSRQKNSYRKADQL